MGNSIVSGSDTSRHPADSLSAAREMFERIVAEFIARPQRRCNFEGLASAAVALHDAGLADLEYRHGRRSGSFGGRMSADLVAGPVCSNATRRFASAARNGKPSAGVPTGRRGIVAKPSPGA